MKSFVLHINIMLVCSTAVIITAVVKGHSLMASVSWGLSLTIVPLALIALVIARSGKLIKTIDHAITRLLDMVDRRLG